MKPEFHKIYNQRAVELLYKQQPDVMPGADKKDSLISALNDACDYEDKPWAILKSGFSRLGYWHFHNTNPQAEEFCLIPFPHHCSSLVRLQNLVASLVNQDFSKDIWIRMGRIIHHIQDMSCPAHAVPVYHTANDSYEKQMDKFYCGKNGEAGINQRISAARIMETPLPSTGNCLKDIEKIYHASATATLNYLKDHSLESYCGGVRKDLGMTAFWIAPVGSAFFGNYGPFGRAFGATLLSGNDGNVYEVKLDAYRQVYDDLYCKVVCESMDVLRILLKFVKAETHA